MTLDRAYHFLFSDSSRGRIERVTLMVAIIGFLVHLGLIYLIDWGFLPTGKSSEPLDDPIAAAYTPFSFILIYEVYLLVYYLPRSITTYISKQYEIITLIIIRRLFKDLANLEISENWFEIQGDLQFTYDIVASLLLFYLLYLFKKLAKQRLDSSRSSGLEHFRVKSYHAAGTKNKCRSRLHLDANHPPRCNLGLQLLKHKSKTLWKTVDGIDPGGNPGPHSGKSVSGSSAETT